MEYEDLKLDLENYKLLEEKLETLDLEELKELVEKLKEKIYFA